jgi:O-acetyl-ADP-ribose deacetylase
MSRHYTLSGPKGLRVVLREGDITDDDADAVVNAANTHMLGGAGVDGAIHRAAGGELYDACLALPVVAGRDTRVRTGDAVLLPGFKLKAKYIIAAVGPVYDGEQRERSLALFKRAHARALAIAAGHAEISTVAFPAISCGIYGFPSRLAAKSVMRMLVARSAEGMDLAEVRFVLFGERMFDVWVSVADSLLAPQGAPP